MKTLQRDKDFAELLARLEALNGSEAARWGRMNLPQMLRHVADAMLLPLGELEVRGKPNWFGRLVVKPAALQLPLPWLRNVPTVPEVDQCRLNRPAGDFADQRRRVRDLLARLRGAHVDGQVHPILGRLRQSEWMRWGWLHADHHLRQFGR